MLAASPLSAVARAQARSRSDPDNFAFWHMPVGGFQMVVVMFGEGSDTSTIASALGVHQSVVANAVGRM